MIKLIPILLMLSLNGYGQNITQKTLNDSLAKVRKEYLTITNNLQAQINTIKSTDTRQDGSINNLIADSTFKIDPKTLSYANQVLTVIGGTGGNVSQKWIDSVNTVLSTHGVQLTQINKDIPQLYTNDQNETLARVNADTGINSRIDLLAIRVTKLESNLSLTVQQLSDLKKHVDEVAATIPKGAQLTY